MGVLCAVDVPKAHAGNWSIEPFCDVPYYVSDRDAQKEQRYRGTIKSQAEGFPPGSGDSPHIVTDGVQPTAQPSLEFSFVEADDGDRMEGSALVWSAGAASEPEGGSGEASLDGNVRLVLRYQPRLDPNDNTESGAFDPNDKPTGLIYIKVTVSPDVSSVDGNSNQSYNVDNEHVTVSIVPGGDAEAVEQTLAEQTTGRTKVISGQRTFYLKLDPSEGGEPGPQSSTLYTVPLVRFQAQATLDGGRQSFGSSGDPTKGWNEGLLRATMGVRAEMTPYFAQITSDIEPSWRKSIGATPPPAYQYIDSNGQYLHAQKVSEGATRSSLDDVWRLECLPAVDGSMRVESAATWVYYGWKGKVLLSAIPKGFSNPDYYWILKSGGSLPYAHDWTNSTWDLSSEMDSVVLPDSAPLPTSVFEVTVTNPMPSLSIVANYNVKWHFPLRALPETCFHLYNDMA